MRARSIDALQAEASRPRRASLPDLTTGSELGEEVQTSTEEIELVPASREEDRTCALMCGGGVPLIGGCVSAEV